MQGDKIDKKAYKFAVEAELSRLFYQLLFLTFMSFLVALMLFLSLYFDIIRQTEEEQELNAIDGNSLSDLGMKATIWRYFDEIIQK